jgi:hypothetical protein
MKRRGFLKSLAGLLAMPMVAPLASLVIRATPDGPALTCVSVCSVQNWYEILKPGDVITVGANQERYTITEKIT